MARGFTKSLYDWCIENERQDILDLWDYELNNCKPNDISYTSKKKYYFKCPRGLHDSELKNISDLTREDSRKALLKCNQCNSFGQWCLDNNKKDWLDLWDYELNNCSSFEVARGSIKKYYFKCPKGIHESEQKRPNDLTKGDNSLSCSKCNLYSFKQWCLDNKHKDWLDLWDYELNDCSPDEIPYGSGKKCYFKCSRGIHKSELKPIGSITGNKNYSLICNQCNSFGQYLIDTYGKNALELYWDYELNEINPFEIAKCSPKKVWIKCQRDSSHLSYQTKCYSFTNGRRCPKCKESKGERRIREILNTYNINFIPQKEFPDLLGVSEWKPLSYDFYIPEQNLLIEYQGEYHDGTANNQTEEEFIKQQEHDKRKCEYAKLHNINLLEIWYYNFDNIEEILNKNIK